MIQKGHSIVYDVSRGRFVHDSCARVLPRPRPHRLRSEVSSVSGPPTLPFGLKPKTAVTYNGEWERYVRFARSRGFEFIPGEHVPWDLALLWDYLRFRAASCKPQTVVSGLSALAHFGARFGHLLATSKHDSDSVTYRRLSMLKRQLAIDFHDLHGGVLYGPNRCTPLGRRDVSLLLSAFGVNDKASFLRLQRRERHHLAITVMQHSAAMRFGHFPARAYVWQQFIAENGCYRLMTDWHRYSGRHRYCLRFEQSPASRARWYRLRDTQGVVVADVSAATIMSWHFEQLRLSGEHTVFAPSSSGVSTRLERQQWLRQALLQALPLSETRARAMVEHVTPHSFRPGLAGDLLEEGMSLDAIASECRWHGRRIVRMYAERESLSAVRRTDGFRTIGHYQTRRF